MRFGWFLRTTLLLVGLIWLASAVCNAQAMNGANNGALLGGLIPPIALLIMVGWLASRDSAWAHQRRQTRALEELARKSKS